MSKWALFFCMVVVFSITVSVRAQEMKAELPAHGGWVEVPAAELPGAIDGFRYAIIDETIQNTSRRPNAGIDASNLMDFAEEFIDRRGSEHDFDRVAEMYADDDEFQGGRKDYTRMEKKGDGKIERRYRFLVEYDDFYFLLGEEGTGSGFISVIGTYRWDGQRWWAVYRTPDFLRVHGDEIRNVFYRQNSPAVLEMLLALYKDEVLSGREE